MIGGAHLQRGKHVALAGSRSQHHDVAQSADVTRLQPTQHVKTVERREIDVEENDRRLDLRVRAGESRHGRFTIGVGRDAHAAALHGVLEESDEHRVVVYDRDIDAPSHGARGFHAGNADRISGSRSRFFQCLQSFLPQGLHGLTVGLVLRDSCARGDVHTASILSDEIQLGDFGADLSELYRRVLLGAAVHPDGEIGTAPPARHVFGAEGFRQQPADCTQNGIRHRAAEVRRQAGEGIDLQYGDRVRIRLSTRQSEEPVDQLCRFECGSQTGKRIGLDRCLPGLDAGQPAFDAHHQLGGHERFADIVVGARREHTLDASLIGVARQEDHWQLTPTAVASHDATELGAADPGHLQIEQNQVRLRFLEHVPEPKWIVQRRHRQSAAGEKRSESTRNHRLVVDDENPASFELRLLQGIRGAGRREARLFGRRRRRARSRGRSKETVAQSEKLFRNRHAIDRRKRLAGQSLREIPGDARPFLKTELLDGLGDGLRVAFPSRLELG